MLSEYIVGVVPNSLQDIGRASDEAERRPKPEAWAGARGFFPFRIKGVFHVKSCVSAVIVFCLLHISIRRS